MTATHTVTITALDNTHLDLPDDQYVDGTQYTVECPGGTSCSLWYECKHADCKDYEPTEDEDDDGQYDRHGVHHQNIEGEWMTDSGKCALSDSDSANEAMQDAAAEAGEFAGLGVHQIELDYEGDGYWAAAYLMPPEAKARVEARAQELHQQGLPSRGPWAEQSRGVQDYFRSKARREERTK